MGETDVRTNDRKQSIEGSYWFRSALRHALEAIAILDHHRVGVGTDDGARIVLGNGWMLVRKSDLDG